MALPAGRVGVNPSQVDNNGNIRGGGGGDISVIDNLNSDSSTDALSAKQGKVLNGKLGGIEFRVHEGSAQYKVNDEWRDFNSASGTGILISEPSLVGVSPRDNTYTIVGGGYAIADGMVYVNIEIESNNDTSLDTNRTILYGLPTPAGSPGIIIQVITNSGASYCNIASNGEVTTRNSITFSDGKINVIGAYISAA